MGVQIIVDLKDLPDIFHKEIRQEGIPVDARTDDDECDVNKYLMVRFPSGMRVRSYCADVLMYDARCADTLTQELQQYHVPYVRT